MSISSLVSRGRPAHRPGPGPMPDAALRSLDLHVRRRMDGLLPGDHAALLLGEGTEFFQVRPYEVGDDVRRIDWNVTARTRTPHVRVEVAERALTAWVLLDTSASMGFGTVDRRKADVAEGVALAIGHVALRRANQVALLSFGDQGVRVLPPARGRRALLGLLSEVRRISETKSGSGLTLAEALRRAQPAIRRRAAVFLVTDLIGPRDFKPALSELCGRCDVTVVEVRDPQEDELDDAGELWLQDPESGRQLRVDTSDPDIRTSFAEAAAAERASVRAVVRACGAEHVVLSTRGDWLKTLALFTRVRRRSR